MTDIEPTVVILLSDKRSGSTIFQKELVKHPQIQHVASSNHTYFETLHWIKGAALLGLPSSFFYNANTYFYTKSLATRHLIRELLFRNGVNMKGNCTDFQLVLKGWDELARKYANPVFFEKSPHHLGQWSALSLLLNWIQSTTLHVKIICLVRDPLDVLYSAEELFGTDAFERQNLWTQAYINWLAFSQLIPNNDQLLIHYEDFISEPKAILNKVAKFIGIQYCDSLGKGVHSKSRNKWINNTNYQIDILPTTQQLALKFGYDLSKYNNVRILNDYNYKLKTKKPLFKRVYQKYNRKRIKLINRFIKPLIRSLIYLKFIDQHYVNKKNVK